MDEYINALKKFDWYYLFSDDHRVYNAGEEASKELELMQKLHDPDFQIWNQHAPKDCRVNP
jgi:hypothetical protein